MDLRENRLFLSNDVRGRFDRYELFTTEEVIIKDSVQLSGHPVKDIASKGIWDMRRASQSFIVPAKGAKYLTLKYNAFNDYPDILADFLDLGANPNDNNILKFCNRYGLFNISGLYSTDFGSSEMVDHDGDRYYSYDYDWVLLSRVGMSVLGGGQYSTEVMHIEEFANKFFPESWEGYKDIIGKNDLHEILSLNYYCEPIYYLKVEIAKRFDAFTNWINDVKNGKSPQELSDSYKGQLITYPIHLTIDYDRGWRYNWVYKSLFDAIDIMFINNIVELTEKVRLCDNCNSAFIASRDKHIFCSYRCGNAARQRDFQKRKKEG